jgi:ABC-type polysaccharide/polyol phosphate transport system ATPase subunit
MVSITLNEVGVDFPVVNTATRSLQLRLYQALGGTFASHKKLVVIRALDGINLDLRDGDRIGLIGHNGAGKTTLLRVLGGIYHPTSGAIKIDGKVSSLTDITLGMDNEATGFDNIIFRCIFMGLTFREARALTPEIAEFSGLGEYLKLPVRTYSAGMFLRLAFSISTAVHPEIMIMDEMISAGDASFMEKVKVRMRELVDRASIIALSSHDLDLVIRFCNKVAWLEHGRMTALGEPDTIIPLYRQALATKVQTEPA